MTTNVSLTPSASYSLTEDLQEPVRSASVCHPAPGEVDFEDLLLQKLGARGWGRVHHFTSQGIECYREVTDEEELVGFDGIPALARRLAAA